MKRKVIYSLVLIFGLVQIAFSQKDNRKIEYSGLFDSYYYRGPLSFTLGGSLNFYAGDLAKGTPGTKFKPGFSLGVNYKVWPRVMFGADFNYFQLASQDWLKRRSISFTSTNMELDLYTRFYLIDDRITRASQKHKLKFLKWYIVGGVGGIRYNPSSTYYAVPDSAYMISENKGFPGMTLVIPFGTGLQFNLSNRTSIVTELVYRYAFTDYLDGVSMRGNPGKKDGYLSFSAKVQYSPWGKKAKKKKRLAPPDPNPNGPPPDKPKPEKKEEPVQEEQIEQNQEQPQEEDQEGGENQEENKEEQPQDNSGW